MGCSVAERQQRETPHDLFRQVLADTGDRITAIRMIRERFGLGLAKAKEVMLQAEGMAATLDEHQERLAEALTHIPREREAQAREVE
jgi:ribosomal protein L7/L12